MLHMVTYKFVQANGLKMTNISTKSFKNEDLIHNNEVQKQSSFWWPPLYANHYSDLTPVQFNTCTCPV